MPGAVTHFGAADAPHCSPMVRAGFVPNVFVNGIPVSCQTHVNTSHLIPAGDICLIHVAPITLGSTQVRVNNGAGLMVGLGRMFDHITTCTFVAQGSPNVFDLSP